MSELDIKAIAERRADYESTVDDIDALITEVEALRQRLTAAETVCTIYGWTSGFSGTPESKATEQAYQDWANTYGAPKPSIEWRGKVRHLAARREENRKRTLARIRSEAGATS